MLPEDTVEHPETAAPICPVCFERGRSRPKAATQFPRYFLCVLCGWTWRSPEPVDSDARVAIPDPRVSNAEPDRVRITGPASRFDDVTQ